MNKAQKYANSKNPQSTSEAKSLLRGYYKKKMTSNNPKQKTAGTWRGDVTYRLHKHDFVVNRFRRTDVIGEIYDEVIICKTCGEKV